MQTFQAIKDSNLQCQIFGDIHLEKGKSYYSFSKLAQDLSKLNIAVLNGNKIPIPDFDKEDILQSGGKKRVLLIHSGGYGDTITIGMLLPLMEKKFEISFDVSCHYDKWEYLLKPMGFKGKWIPYPIDLGSIKDYDCILTEIIKYVTQPARLLLDSPLEVLAESFDISLFNIQVKFELPEEIKRANRLPEKNIIRIGLNFDSMGGIKSYPKDLQPVLVHSLKALGVELYFFGTKPLSPDIDLFNNRLHDFTGKTSIPELTVLLEQMDIIIGVDSFVSHLGAVIGKPTVVLLSTTSKAYFNHYQKVRIVDSEEACAPCFHTGNQCPRGYTRCCAFHHESVLPHKIVMTAVKEIALLYSGRNEQK